MNHLDSQQEDKHRIIELESEARHYQRIISSLKEIVFQTDATGLWTFLNPAWEDVTGYTVSECIGTQFIDYVHPNDRVSNQEKFTPLINREKEFCKHQVRYLKKSGGHCWIEVYASLTLDENSEIIGTTGTLTDITTQRLLEQEMGRAQRFESVGFLAAGIAHDFNNLLTVILSNFSLLNSDAIGRGNSELKSCVDDALNATNRAKELAQQLLTFAKGGEPIRELTDVVSLVQDAVNLGVSGRSVTLTFEIVGTIPKIEIDKAQISQVISNIVINSVEAMPEGGKISVRIQLRQKHAVHSENSPENMLDIEIADSGIGMDKTTQEHLFDLYFSTKQRGSGLGLALVYSIIERHLGRISVESEQNVGTTVSISLPAVGAHYVKRDENSTAIEQPQFNLKHCRILVLDDDEQILRSIKLILKSLRLDVVTVNNGAKAVEVYVDFLKSEKPFDLIICDLILTDGMDGIETMEKIKAIDPNVVAIVSSGYSNDLVMGNPENFGFKGVLNKPYSINKLKQVLVDVLI